MIFQSINCVRPSNLAEEQETRFEKLVAEARHRMNEERGRMEDEAAARIDASKARDPRTLASLNCISINPERRVNARDYFDLHLEHSSGQRLDCRVELLLREDPPGKGDGGDLLICEVDQFSKRLLFPPIDSGNYSARSGDLQGELVVMIRGTYGPGEEWHELLSLLTHDELVCAEWIQMLGLHPVPPAIYQQPFKELTAPQASASEVTSLEASTDTDVGRLSPSTLKAIEVPIGEHMEPLVQDISECRVGEQFQSLRQPPSLENQSVISTVSSTAPSTSQVSEKEENRIPSLLLSSKVHTASPPRDLNEAMAQAGGGLLCGKLRRTKAQRIARSTGESLTRRSERMEVAENINIQEAAPPAHPHLAPLTRSNLRVTSVSSSSIKDVSQTNDSTVSFASIPDNHRTPEDRSSSALLSDSSPETSRPYMSRRTSSVPSLDRPSILKMRKNSPSSHSTGLGLEEMRAQSTITSQASEVSKPGSNALRTGSPTSDITKVLGKEEPTSPSPPPHQGPHPMQLRNTIPKIETPSPGFRLTNARRSSSPLKHEYAPSSPSDASSEAQSSSEGTTLSDTSEEEEPEDGDIPTPLPPIAASHRLKKASPQGSIFSLPNATLTPSESASQAPYRAVPKQPMKAHKCVASIYSWSDKGAWERLHPSECSIVVTPGLIEAYEMGASHSKPLVATEELPTTPSSPLPEEDVRPLIGQELTPIVQIRCGTALDISIRSPLTKQSKLAAGNHIMFRSRCAEESEALYALINYGRINNPRYIALQNSRRMRSEVPCFAVNRQASVRRSSRWSFRSRRNGSSYQASSGATTSISASENSVGTTTTAFSALKLFGAGGRYFNIAKSTISSRKESTSTSLYSSSASSGYGKEISATALDSNKDAPIGGSEFKIRFRRWSSSKWRDMGDARLSIQGLPPGFHQHGFTGQEKRIIVKGRTAGETLLDVCLAGNAFRRTGRTGIAINIMEEVVGPNGEVGQVAAFGGVGSKTKKYRLDVSFLREMLVFLFCLLF